MTLKAPQYQQKQLVVLDPGLCFLGGHNYTVTTALTEGAIQAGFYVIWLCNKKFDKLDLIPNVHVERIFTHSYYSYLGLPKWRRALINIFGMKQDIFAKLSPQSTLTNASLPIPLIKQQLFPFIKELFIAFKKLNILSNDHVIITTAEYLQYEAILVLVQTVDPERLPTIHLRTSFDETSKPNRIYGTRLPHVFSQFKATGLVGKRIFFYAETRQLADYYNRWGIVNFHVLENPLPSCVTLFKKWSNGERKPGIPFLVLFPGEGRKEKGFHRLPNIIDITSRYYTDKRNPIRFIVPGGRTTSARGSVLTRKTVDKLRTFPGSIVNVKDIILSIDEYYEIIAQSDIVILPYDAKHYKNRSSMILVESIILGKPIILSKGTSLETTFHHEAIKIAETDEDFVEQICELIKNYDYYERSIKNFGDTIFERFNPISTVHGLTRVTG